MGSRITLGAFLRGQMEGDRPSFARADVKLGEMKDYLNRAIHSIRSRRAYIVPAGRWKYNQKRRRIEIDKDYYPRLAADMTEQLESNGRKPEAAPSITSECAYAVSDRRLFDDSRSSHASKGFGEQQFTEGFVDGSFKRNRGAFHRINLANKAGRGGRMIAVTDEGENQVKGQLGKALWFPQSTYVLEKKREFVEMLHSDHARHHEPLKAIFEKDYPWPSFTTTALGEEAWRYLTDLKRDGTMEQRQFVERALATPDFTFVWGPAGSGKTTAICEFIRQCVRRRQKVLLVGSTHVAVDNVLEKFCSEEDGKLNRGGDAVIPVRVGRGEKVAPRVEKLLLKNFVKTEGLRIAKHLNKMIANGDRGASAAKILAESMGGFMRLVDQTSAEERAEFFSHPLLRQILDGANLVCGTTLGVLQYPGIKNALSSKAYPEFDYVILDEASKTTLDEFLVPALCARRWIIVGDPYQLAPFCEEAELTATSLAAMTAPSKPAEAAARPALMATSEVKKKLRAAINAALEERAVRMGGGCFHENAVRKLAAARSELAPFVTPGPGGKGTMPLISLFNQVSNICLPSVLESLMAGQPGLERSVSEFIPPLGPALDARLVSLRFQHRMDHRIADFCKDAVYGGRQLITASTVKRDKLHAPDGERLSSLILDPSLAHLLADLSRADGKLESRSQLVLAAWELLRFARWTKSRRSEEPDGMWSAYLVSTYRNQNALMERLVDFLLEKHGDLFANLRVEANTVDSCQGHEADLVLLSLVYEDRQTEFMRSLNRMNVALTRARSRLVILGSLPPKTREGVLNPADASLLDRLGDYPNLVQVAAKGPEIAQAIKFVNQALHDDDE